MCKPGKTLEKLRDDLFKAFYIPQIIEWLDKLLRQLLRKNKKIEKKYKWNTIIDENTCPVCLELNGKMLTKEEIKNLSPPLHHPDGEDKRECRCYLTEYWKNGIDGLD